MPIYAMKKNNILYYLNSFSWTSMRLKVKKIETLTFKQVSNFLDVSVATKTWVFYSPLSGEVVIIYTNLNIKPNLNLTITEHHELT